MEGQETSLLPTELELEFVFQTLGRVEWRGKGVSQSSGGSFIPGVHTPNPSSQVSLTLELVITLPNSSVELQGPWTADLVSSSGLSFLHPCCLCCFVERKARC
jgi:hypothetical protein